MIAKGNKSFVKMISIAALIVLILAILPALYIGRYAHPSVDDYYYGALTKEAYQKTGTFVSVLKTSKEQMMERYENWQGNFAGIFVMGLMPAVFGEGFYAMVPILLILSFVICSYFFFHISLRKIFYANTDEARFLASIFTLISFEFTGTPSDAFYWFNGGSYYCFFYSMMLLMFGLLCMVFYSNKKLQTLWMVPIVILSFFIGGSNYTTAFITVLLLIGLNMLLLMKKDKRIVYSLLAFTGSCSSLIISVVAPGNAIRQASVEESFGAVKAIAVSFVYGTYSVAKSSSFLLVIIMTAIFPLILRMVKRSQRSFSHPLTVIVLSFCFYCAQATPVIYAQGFWIPYRLQNIIMFSFYIWLVFVYIYAVGYLEKRYKISKNSFIASISVWVQGRKIMIVLNVTLLLLFAMVGQIRVINGENRSPSFSNLPVTVSAVYSILKGDAKQFDLEYKERLIILENDDIKKAKLKEYSVKPELLFHSDITEDKKHWRNLHVARYYQKMQVVLMEE